jgi:hypothetical protein
MNEPRPKNLWVLMVRCQSGRYVPSMDHFCAWSSRSGARWKIKEIGAARGEYREFKYSRVEKEPS